MHIFLWLLLTLLISFMFLLVWIDAAENIKRDNKWMLYTPLWIVTSSAYEKDGFRICIKAVALQIAILVLGYLLLNGYVARN